MTDNGFCEHESYLEPDQHGYSICLDCSELLQGPVFYLLLPDWWDWLDSLEKPEDDDPGDCTK